MDRFQTRLNRVTKTTPRAEVDIRNATPQELKWNQLSAAARVDKELEGLLGAFTGACASARLHSKNSGADMLAVRDRLGEINDYLRRVVKKSQLCIDNIGDLPPIQWEGYQR